MKKKLTQESLEFFERHNISFHNRFGTRLKIGDNMSFLDNLYIEPYVGFHQGYNLFELGYMSYSNSALPINIKIGRYCSIARGVNFIVYNHPLNCLSTSIFSHDRSTDLTIRAIRDFMPTDSVFDFVDNPQKGPVTIDHDVWVGQNCTLSSGINLGTGCVVAANSIVTKDVPPYAIIGGNPAKIIRFRFAHETIYRLLESKWWEYNFTDFAGLDISTPENFLNGFERIKADIAKFNPQKVKISECPFYDS